MSQLQVFEKALGQNSKYSGSPYYLQRNIRGWNICDSIGEHQNANQIDANQITWPNQSRLGWSHISRSRNTCFGAQEAILVQTTFILVQATFTSE